MAANTRHMLSQLNVVLIVPTFTRTINITWLVCLVHENAKREPGTTLSHHHGNECEHLVFSTLYRSNCTFVLPFLFGSVLFHLLQTVISMVQLTIGYGLMLIVMTYNAWFLIAVAVGAGMGHLILSRDLERLYANYARSAMKKKKLREAAKRKTCVKTPPCRTSWKKISRQESLG